MIFTTRALKVELTQAKEPIMDLLQHRLSNALDYKRKQYFIRYIGWNKEKDSYILDIQELSSKLKENFPFLYLSELDNKVTYEMTQKYSQIYESYRAIDQHDVQKLFKLKFPIHFNSEIIRVKLALNFSIGKKLF